MAPARIYGDIQHCLKNYPAERIFIRLVGSMGGTRKVNELLEKRKLSVKRVRGGLSILIDSSEVFLFDQSKWWRRRFTLAYERDPNITGIIPCLQTGINPDNPNLPPVNTSFFRSCNYDPLLEIYFKGKIPLKFHSWWDKEQKLKYWCVDRNKK